ncbi:AAA family ATPase [Mycobacterium sp. MAA66]|uniref:AAA family ATPase n=1 Tax=Mycobacterium sp. MAA66 TaxID=3156297 RepID=UPI00351478C5
MPWNVPQHAEALTALTAALEDEDCPGAVVLGPDGGGKSTLARLAAEQYAAAHPEAVLRRVTGTPTERNIPFGAFSHLVDVSDIGKPAALLRAARESLHADAHDVLIVDDANQLDALSATLVYQVALAGETKMIVTARADTSPQAIRALWDDALMRRIDIGTDSATTDPAEVRRFVAELPGPARAALDLLTVQEPIPLTDLVTLTSESAVRDAERLGAVERFDDDGTALVYTAHPLFAETARSALGDGARALRGRVLPLTAARAREHASDRLRVAELALGSDTPQSAQDVLAAAAEALRLGDLTLTERLAEAALVGQDSLAARLLLGQAMAWQGRGREADQVLSAVDACALSDLELIDWALPRAANQFWMLGEPELATAFLHSTRNRLTEPAAQRTIDALAATFAMNAGNPGRAVELAEEVLSSTDASDTAVAWAASSASLCAARMGRFDKVDQLALRASAAEHPGLLRFTVGLAQTSTLLMAGDTAGARTVAQQYTDFAELQQPGRAIGEVLLARVLLETGELDSAAELLGPASKILERTGYSWGPLSLTLRATALAQLGHLTESAKVLARAESRHGTKSALFAPELGLARAWRLRAGRDEHGAVNAARQAAGMAERSGQFAVAVLCWRDAVRLGDVRALGSLERVAQQADCAVAREAVPRA